MERNRSLKQRHVENGTVHQILVYDGDECVGWCQYGSPSELPNIKNPGAYAKELSELPDWRIGCIFTGSRHRGRGVAQADGRRGVGRHPGRGWRDGRGLPRAG